MTGFHPPGNHIPEEEDKARGSEERKMPDFIFVDSESEYREEAYGGYQREFDPEFQKMAVKEYPLILRFFCLIFSALILLVSAVAFLFVLFFFAGNLLTFFQMDQFWKQTKNLWEQLKKLFVSGLGLAIAVISPAFGFSIIMVYLLLKGSTMDEDWVSRMMKDRFYRK